jgi:hypothetical protein
MATGVPETIDITPDVSLLKKAGEVNYKIPQALAELVDNAIDARLADTKLHIEVLLGQRDGKKVISVIDDGSGMTKDEARDAMVMARSQKNGKTIGEFGLGMKTACSFLGAEFEIITATQDAQSAMRLYYGEDAFLARGIWQMDMEEIEKPFDHGTHIVIRQLKVNLYAGVKTTVLENFGKVFRHFVASGAVEIVVNSDIVVPHVYDTIKEYDTEIDFDVNGKRVRGWASLAPKVSMKGAYGIDLIRHNRLMIEHAKVGFTAQAGLSYLIGELHLDDFPVVNNKTDFRRDTSAWQDMEKALSERLLDLKRASREKANPARMAPKDEAEVKEYIDQVKDALKSDDLQSDLDRRALDAALADELTVGPIPFQLPTGVDDDGSDERLNSKGSETPSVDDHRLKRVKTQLRNLNIEHQVAKLGRESAYKIWDVEGVGAKKKLVVTTNQDHPVYRAVEGDFLVWVKHNIAEAVAEFFTQETARTEAMLSIKSDILKHIGKMRLELAEEETLDAKVAAAPA